MEQVSGRITHHAHFSNGRGTIGVRMLANGGSGRVLKKVWDFMKKIGSYLSSSLNSVMASKMIHQLNFCFLLTLFFLPFFLTKNKLTKILHIALIYCVFIYKFIT